MKKIGLYGGTFDPIHFGHINLAFELMEKKGLDEVWFIPAKTNPYKTHLPMTPFAHRLRMLELALEGIPQFKINPIENSLSSPSYTINTVEAIKAQSEQENEKYYYYLLLGEDVIPTFSQWHRAVELVQIIPLLIGTRNGLIEQTSRQIEEYEIKKAIEEGKVNTYVMDISSRNIRDRLSRQLPCGHLVPANVLDYALVHHLYS